MLMLMLKANKEKRDEAATAHADGRRQAVRYKYPMPCCLTGWKNQLECSSTVIRSIDRRDIRTCGSAS